MLLCPDYCKYCCSEHWGHSQLLVLFLLTVQSFSIFGCEEENQSDFSVDHLELCSLQQNLLLGHSHRPKKVLLAHQPPNVCLGLTPAPGTSRWLSSAKDSYCGHFRERAWHDTRPLTGTDHGGCLWELCVLCFFSKQCLYRV